MKTVPISAELYCTFIYEAELAIHLQKKAENELAAVVKAYELLTKAHDMAMGIGTDWVNKLGDQK